ncbi:MAG: hypothetical protein ABIV63_13370 [Caldimonas sp.]
MTEFIHPGVFLEETSTGGHSIPGVSTSTSGLIGTDVIRKLQHYIAGDPTRWRDRDPQDPSVALLEVFAWLTEQLVARSNLIPPEGVPHAARLAKAALILSGRPAKAEPPSP